MYFDNRIQYKPILAFLPFGLRSVRYGPVVEIRGAHEGAPQTYSLDHNKSTRAKKPKGMQKSDKKSAYIPYLDNIEITLMKIFVKTTEISGKSGIFLVNRLFSVVGSTSVCDRILVIKVKREMGVSLGGKNKYKELP